MRTPAATHSTGPSAAPEPPRRLLERLVVLHVGVLLIGSTWAFGGAADWARTLLAVWGSLSLILLPAALIGRARRGAVGRPALWWLLPWLGFNLLVLLSALNPSFATGTFAGQTLLIYTGPSHPALPSTAHAATSLKHLWLFDALYLSAFNLLVAVRRRRALRGLLAVAVGNAAILAVFGSFQKLGADGLYFGRVPSPNARYFATFVYANHWAAFVVLLLAAGLGLLAFLARRAPDVTGAPSALPLGGLAVLLMALTPLLAGSRAGTALVAILLVLGALHALRGARRRRPDAGSRSVAPLAALLAGALLVGAGGAYVARESIRERWHDTAAQWQSGLLAERAALYADTWRMVAERPAFGWGLGTFGQVLQLQRPRPLEPDRQYEHSYVEAHSDWLQSLAEVGVTGTLLLVLCVVLPLAGSQALPLAGALPAYLLGGCGLVTLYAAVEFPFANPSVAIAFWTCFFAAVQYVRLSSRARTRP